MSIRIGGIESEDKVADAEYDKLVADAKRYRFVRQYADPNFDDGDFPIEEDPVSSEHMDVLIDAAMIKTGFKG